MIASVLLTFHFIRKQQLVNESNQKLAEAMRKASQANEAKSEFLSRMSHEILTPLNGVMGMITLALLHCDHKERWMNDLKKAEFSAKFLLNIINDVLDLSKIESGKMTLSHNRFHMQKILQEVTAIFTEQAKKRANECINR